MSKSPLFSRCESFFHSLMNTFAMRAATFLVAILIAGICLHFVNAYLLKEIQQAEAPLTNQDKQQIIAPILSIPYVEHITSINTVLDNKGESRVETKDIYHDKRSVLLPEDLDIKVNVQKEDAQLWAKYQLSGTFNYSELLIEPESGKRNIRWDSAKLMIGLDNLANLHKEVIVIWDDESIPLSAGNIDQDLITSGFSAIPSEPEEDAEAIHTFDISFKTPLFSKLSLAPLGLHSRINIAGIQQDIEVLSEIKPTETTKTYLAWDVSPLARPYTNYWIQEELKAPFNLSKPEISIQLKQASHYANFKVLLSYAPWISCFILLSLFALELWGKQRIAGMHYLLLGVAWCAVLYSLWIFHNVQVWSTLLLIILGSWCAIASIYVGSLLGFFKGFFFAVLQIALFVGVFYFFTESESKQMQWLVFMLVLVGVGLLGGSRKASPPTLIN